MDGIALSRLDTVHMCPVAAQQPVTTICGEGHSNTRLVMDQLPSDNRVEEEMRSKLSEVEQCKGP